MVKIVLPVVVSSYALAQNLDFTFDSLMNDFTQLGMDAAMESFGPPVGPAPVVPSSEEVKEKLLVNMGKGSHFMGPEITAAFVDAIWQKANGDINNMPPVVLQAAGVNDGLTRSTLSCRDEDCTVPINLEGLWGYGCWCHFGADLMRGHGDPQNDHDTICMDLQNCLRCIQIDEVPATVGGGICNPKSSTFQLGASFFSGEQALMTECGAANSGNDCGKFSCVCEMNFIAALVDKMFEGYVYDASFKHDDAGGSWNFEDNCITPHATAPKTKECCGNYPSRVPFYIENRSCCEATQELYSEVSHNCCDDGVKAVGEVC